MSNGPTPEQKRLATPAAASDHANNPNVQVSSHMLVQQALEQARASSSLSTQPRLQTGKRTAGPGNGPVQGPGPMVYAANRGAEEVIWQPWTTMMGVTMNPLVPPSGANYQYIQPSWRWLDLSNRDYVDILLEILGIGVAGTVATHADLSLAIQTANGEDGLWGSTVTFTAATMTMMRFTTDPNSAFPVGRFLRMAVIPGTATTIGPWQMTYRASAFPDAAGGQLLFNSGVGDPSRVHANDWQCFHGSYTTQYGGSLLGIQPAEDWLRSFAFQYLVFEIEITAISGATLYMEGAFNEEGPWTALGAYATAYTLVQLVMGPTPTATIPVIPPLIRWRVYGEASGGGFWMACFRVNPKWS